jgi:hypothetical protein
MHPKLKAIGTRGSWFAMVNGESLPCVHQHWLKGLHYCDPNLKPGKPYWDRFVRAIDDGGRVILTKGDHLGGTNFRRTGYIVIFSVKQLSFLIRD